MPASTETAARNPSQDGIDVQAAQAVLNRPGRGPGGVPLCGGAWLPVAPRRLFTVELTQCRCHPTSSGARSMAVSGRGRGCAAGSCWVRRRRARAGPGVHQAPPPSAPPPRDRVQGDLSLRLGPRRLRRCRTVPTHQRAPPLRGPAALLDSSAQSRAHPRHGGADVVDRPGNVTLTHRRITLLALRLDQHRQRGVGGEHRHRPPSVPRPRLGRTRRRPHPSENNPGSSSSEHTATAHPRGRSQSGYRCPTAPLRPLHPLSAGPDQRRVAPHRLAAEWRREPFDAGETPSLHSIHFPSNE